MSPKKAHEVARMSTYVLHLVRENNIPEHTLRIVDIGAGQGYLTRALKSHLKSAHILALDADEEQTRGAQKWEERLLPNASPPINHETMLISPQNLLDTIDLWVSELAPVIFVALHACGSLTPDILRAYISASRSRRTWYPAGLVAVGCCYNLMNPVGPSPSAFSFLNSILTSFFSNQTFPPSQESTSITQRSSIFLYLRITLQRRFPVNGSSPIPIHPPRFRPLLLQSERSLGVRFWKRRSRMQFGCRTFLLRQKRIINRLPSLLGGLVLLMIRAKNFQPFLNQPPV